MQRLPFQWSCHRQREELDSGPQSSGMVCGRELMYRRNRIGPRWDPCGTPAAMAGCGYGGSDFDRELPVTKVTGEPRKCVLGCKRAQMVEADELREGCHGQELEIERKRVEKRRKKNSSEHKLLSL